VWLAIILYMTVIPVADARAKLSRLVESAVNTHERTTITRNGVPAAVLLSVDDYESMQETIEVLADPELMAAIKEGIDDLAAGRVHDQQDVARAMRAAGRL
jgi:antitoxin YefM